MVTTNRRCSECKSEMILDRVVKTDEGDVFYYACVNPNCRERGKAYTVTGNESESTVKERE